MTIPPAPGQTILVVDDDPTIVTQSGKILKEAGYTVLQATGSSDALKLNKNHRGRIDLLVTDLVMPPPGFQLASGDNEFPHVHGHDLAIRMLQMRKDLHVVLMSDNIEKDVTGYGIRRGILPMLQKPFQPQALLDLVRQVLQSSPPTAESLTQPTRSGSRDGDEWFD